jgi:molybdate transport system substrate-binding protein
VAPALDAAFARRHAGRHAEFTFGASGTLVTQILHGAPFQVFLSADVDFAQKLVDAGQAAGPVKVYAVGTLILLTTKKRDLSRGLAVLLDPSIEKIAITNPDTAPYGRAAREALISAGLFDALRSRIVMAQNVNQTLQFTLTGADAGLVATASLSSPELQPYRREGEFWIPVDPALYSPIRQGFVVMRSAASLPDVAAFAEFLTSPEARAVFASFGYGAP